MKTEKILIISLSGIGNTLMFTPTLERIGKNYPKAQIDVVTLYLAIEDLLRTNKSINEVILLNERKKTSLKRNIAMVFKILDLRKRKYDISITAFPSTKFQYNILAFLLGAKKRITHKYSIAKLRSLSFLQNVKIPVQEGIHDIEQNLNLLDALKIAKVGPIKMTLSVPEAENEKAKEFLKPWKNRKKICLHPGSSTAEGFSYKRWSIDNFVEVAKGIKGNPKFLILGGPEESEMKSQLQQALKDSSTVEGSIVYTAAIINNADLFIGNDAGLMHIAAALEIPTIGIFGVTSSVRTGPFGQNCVAVRKEPVEEVFTYPFKTTNASLKEKDLKYLELVLPKDVLKALDKLKW